MAQLITTLGPRRADELGMILPHEHVFVDLRTWDAPGYGGSDRFRGRRVVDSVADVSAIADSLGIDRFAVIGGSWGGPHSLAVADYGRPVPAAVRKGNVLGAQFHPERSSAAGARFLKAFLAS